MCKGKSRRGKLTNTEGSACEDNTAFDRIFNIIPPPPKPREEGLNMCLDDGIGIVATKDLLQVVGKYIDSIRLGRGISALFPKEWVLEKTRLCREFEIDIQTGGPIYEVAVARGMVEEFLQETVSLGFTSVEFSENIISLPLKTTTQHIKIANGLGLHVYFEYGRKYPDNRPISVEEASEKILTQV